MKKIISLVMAMAMALSMGAMSFATDITTAGNSGSAEVQLTAAAANFSVTVPTVVAFNIAADGSATCATNYAITNNSIGKVKVSSITTATGSGWTANDYDTVTMYDKKVDSKNYAFTVTGKNASDADVTIKTTGKDALSSTTPAWKSMEASGGSNTLPLTFAAKFSPFSSAQSSTTFATVTITVAWDKAS